jgi:hypothetical protein
MDESKYRPLLSSEVKFNIETYKYTADNIPETVNESVNNQIERIVTGMYPDQGKINKGYLRLVLFAERNNMTISESMEFLLTRMLTDSGRVQEKFRKQRLLPNEVW